MNIDIYDNQEAAPEMVEDKIVNPLVNQLKKPSQIIEL
jgi:hypothetical protein